jgi:hypothetical protein
MVQPQPSNIDAFFANIRWDVVINASSARNALQRRSGAEPV